MLMSLGYPALVERGSLNPGGYYSKLAGWGAVR
jgi:hypothetical protein